MNGCRQQINVIIIGGGLVGSLCACFMAERGHIVNLYEYRNDIRKMEHVQGRSINLAMSARAKCALKQVRLEDDLILDHGIPMQGRMIHSLDNSKHSILYDVRTKQCIYSVARKYLNEVLLTAAEKYDNVTLHFNHKLVNADLDEGRVTIMQTQTKQTIEITADLIIGADGVFSAVRRSMMTQPLFDFNQKYIEHGYLELCIPPSDNKFAMEENYLHIWPRGEFMMIALPNQDRTWTVTLFMPFAKFKLLDTSETLLAFFQKYFPDSVELIGRKHLVNDFFKATPSPLVSIKCHPYHVSDRAVIIGDAAHGMVPFYGQGMNAGFEDCYILNQLMEEHEDNLQAVLPAFTKIRYKDAHAICDLAMYNYIEMRDLVNKKSFRLRKKLDDFLYWLLPDIWVPLYNSVSFTRMGYQQCVNNRHWQDKVITRAFYIFFILIFIIGTMLLVSSNKILDIIETLKLL
ncbi:cinnabar [Carabus blaptoides fortunei]